MTNAFESFLIQNGIVLTEALQKWRREKPGSSLESLLLDHAHEIREDLWIESWSQREASIPILPVTGLLPLAPTSFQSELQEAQLNRGFAVILDQPFFRIVLLHPLHREEIEAILKPWIGDHPCEWWLVTPMILKNLFQGHLSNPENLLTCTWGESDALDEQFQKWFREPLDRMGVVYETATHLWIVTCELSEKIDTHARELYGKVIHVFRVSEKEWKRLRQIPFLKERDSHHLRAPVIDSWRVDWGQSRMERDFLEDLLQHAIERRASDIHLEPKRDYVRVRFRIHGELIVQPPIPLNRYPLILRRAKVLSGMRPDLAPCNQDGAADLMCGGRRYDQRYSILLLKEDQECLVIRIFGSELPTLDQLHLGTRERETLDWFLGLESGMLVTSGPTGSGKTTTLYACLSALDSPQRRIVTVEHPVEKYFENATQVDIREGKLSFAQALRTILRQDPDVIMVGEMRDPESAEMAVHAALTGHLVLSTTHALDSVGVLERMGGSFKLDRVALGYSLKLSVAQRLIALLCPHCKKERLPDDSELRRFGAPKIKGALVCERVGCGHCHGTGLQGRRVVMEMMPVDESIIDRLESEASPQEIREWNRSRGFQSIQDQVIDLFYAGEVEPSEARSFLSSSTKD